jgi:hypothetical protein
VLDGQKLSNTTICETNDDTTAATPEAVVEKMHRSHNNGTLYLAKKKKKEGKQNNEHAFTHFIHIWIIMHLLHEIFKKCVHRDDGK